MDPDELLRVAIASRDEAYPSFPSSLHDATSVFYTNEDRCAAEQQLPMTADELLSAALAARELTGAHPAPAAAVAAPRPAGFDSPAAVPAAVVQPPQQPAESPPAPPLLTMMASGSAPLLVPNPPGSPPSLLEMATRVGAVGAVCDAVIVEEGESMLPILTPAAPPLAGPELPFVPPPVTPTLFTRGGRLFASPAGKLAPSAMRARAFKASAFALAREGDLALALPPKGTTAYRPGVSVVEPSELALPDLDSVPDLPPDSAEGVKVKKLHEEIKRLLALLTIPMAATALSYSSQEATTIDPKVLGSELFGALAKRGTATMQGARRALVRLNDFALARGVQLEDFGASVGLISAFLTAQSAVTMPRQLLLGLRWAATVLKVCPNALAPILDGFKSKARPGQPLPAMCFSLKAMLHLSHIATTYGGTAQRYVCAVASGIHLMGQGSLRWADTFGCTFTLQADAVDGFTKKAKTGPMPWWAELLDARGSSAWLAPLVTSLAPCRRPDFIFRRASFKGVRRDPEAFVAWDLGPAPKAHVIKCLLYILTLPPLSLSYEEAARYSRLHGARRFYPTLARFFSSVIDITVQDRLELGRWQPGLIGDPASRATAASASMPNLYSGEGARDRCVQSRGKVARELRRLVAAASPIEIEALPTDSCGIDCLMSGYSMELTAVDPDPDLSDDESGDES